MSKSKIVLAAVIWLVVLAIGVLAWKLVIDPVRSKAKEVAEKKRQEDIVSSTSAEKRNRTELTVGIDSFSGYAVFRSPEFHRLMEAKGFDVKLVDDAANYPQRADSLEKGTLQFALFPADALLKTFSKFNSSYMPATIVAIIDETRGADAMLAYKNKFPDVDKLNNPDVRFVLVGDSPSETLARVVIQDFGLSKISPSAFDAVASPEEVIARYRKANASTNEVFVTWEPYTSQIQANEAMHVLVDSSRFTGYIVDTLVVNRDFLAKQKPVVDTLLECYFTALFAFRDKPKLVQLMLDDAKLTKLELDSKQAEKLVNGIHWKNTQENLAHFGLRSGAVIHVQDILSRISAALKKSNAIENDPVDRWEKLFYDMPLKQLQTQNFHPGLQSEEVREEAQLAPLSDAQWQQLSTVGTLSVDELVFARGSAVLTDRSRNILDDLAVKLRAWPLYYVMIRGTATKVGDAEANRTLAAKRAQSALEYLQSLGLPAARMRTVPSEITGESRVTFSVGQLPY